VRRRCRHDRRSDSDSGARRRGVRDPIAVVVAAVALACACAPARAQLGVTLTALSDSRFRGVSMSDDRPAGAVSINYDAASGWYAGLSASAVALAPHHLSPQLVGYGGLVFAATGAARPEVGLSAVQYVGDASYDYLEGFVGLVAERWTGRLYFAPDYFGRGVRTVYGEAAANLPLDGGWRLLAHAGAIVASGAAAPVATRRFRLDALAGLGWSRGRTDLQLTWVTSSREGPYPAAYTTRRSGPVLGASLAF
jgi:uncharacterized protein (TIGR02001 family)